MARQIGQMLNAREPKIVNGPEILDKYVGESEAKVRALFAEAEEEEKRCGVNSGLHIIILDELDAICKQRGSAGAGSSGLYDSWGRISRFFFMAVRTFLFSCISSTVFFSSTQKFLYFQASTTLW